MTLPPPGWFADPDHEGQERYWNGAEWTPNTRAPGGLASVPPPASRPPAKARHLIAKPGETIYAEMGANLATEVPVRKTTGGGGGISFPIGFGARANFRGSPQQTKVVGSRLAVADQGVLSITSQRAVFIGRKKTIEHLYSKLLSVRGFADGVELAVSNRQAATRLFVADGEKLAPLIRGMASGSGPRTTEAPRADPGP